MYEWIGKMAGSRRLARVLFILSGWMPKEFMIVICKSIGMLFFGMAGNKLRAQVISNLRDLLPEQNEKHLKAFRMQYFQNLAVTMYELILESFRLAGSESWRFRIQGEQYLTEALQLGRGAIVYTPHAGNFFYYYWYLCRNYSCLTIATAGSPELRPLYLRFQEMGCPGLDYDVTPPIELLRKLRKHLAGNGVVFLLGDFWRPTFPVSRFFGKATRTPEGAASLAIEQKVPIIPFYGHRLKGFTHELVFEQPLHLYEVFSRQQRAEATLLLNSFMEKVIRKYPEQWFYWFNAEERWENEQGNPTAADSDIAGFDHKGKQNSSFPA